MSEPVLPVEDGFELEFAEVAGLRPCRLPLGSCVDVRFERAAPVRSFRWTRGEPGFPGWWWFATTGELVGYESWLERDRLALLDYDPQVVGVASQPFRLRWRDEAGRVQVAHLGVPTSFPNLVGSLVGQSWSW